MAEAGFLLNNDNENEDNMFDIPDAKRIRRADLTMHSRSASPSPSPSPELQKALNAHLASLYGPISSSPPSPTQHPQPQHPSSQKQTPSFEPSVEFEFEFCLFSTTTTTTTTTGATPQKIILETDNDEAETNNQAASGSSRGGFLRPRPREYYISSGPSDEVRAHYASAALEGEDVLRLAGGRNWGLEVPWRVSVLRSRQSKGMGVGDGARIEGGEEEVEKGKKTKAGKKRRILLREKRRKKEVAEEGRRRREEEREVAEREKRTRRNREKKVKRKMKERAMKGVGGGGGEGEGGSEGDRREFVGYR
ncbi:uncharacterized protein LY89DRAFT_786371 [Mollisia scopiformis]|uniref:Uncharacterized protein n=1 Tax=Mollisia scopiformis TaxID=149040 RepID=A0A194WU02_MOLSC|nr:uncharacterized protein LY89DRAFT_786371 [Mollisia scopiformis]KUJ11435.1 hypothetical protein LY89DRAFT_786371 [Mollisia scopiformis]